jgi:thiamine-phosphate pyrophosphorylase
LFPVLYAIVDPRITSTPAVALVRALSEAGVGLIQLRDKHASAASIYAQIKELLDSASRPGTRLIVNDRPDIAAITGAGGVHVGQDDLPVEEARAICGPSKWVGVSTHNLDQVRQADRTSADYIAVGPIFPTTTKAKPDPVVGVQFLRAARRLTPKPLVAIGGITAASAEGAYRAGADSVAVIRDLVLAPDTAARVREYLAAARRAGLE